MNNEQLRIKHLAENLLATLNEVVPSNTIHYVVANNERWLKHLAEQAHTIPTVEPKTWTFMGHWVGDRIVIDYSVPGKVQDDRQDESGQYPEGLWASSASGATEEEAAAAAIAEYEDEDDEPGRTASRTPTELLVHNLRNVTDDPVLLARADDLASEGGR